MLNLALALQTNIKNSIIKGWSKKRYKNAFGCDALSLAKKRDIHISLFL